MLEWWDPILMLLGGGLTYEGFCSSCVSGRSLVSPEGAYDIPVEELSAGVCFVADGCVVGSRVRFLSKSSC